MCNFLKIFRSSVFEITAVKIPLHPIVVLQDYRLVIHTRLSIPIRPRIFQRFPDPLGEHFTQKTVHFFFTFKTFPGSTFSKGSRYKHANVLMSLNRVPTGGNIKYTFTLPPSPAPPHKPNRDHFRVMHEICLPI